MIEVKSNFNIAEYVSLVNMIASDFFDDEGSYTPHIGKLNAMRVFYNECVTKSDFDIDHDIVDDLELEVLLNNDEFIKEFNDAIYSGGYVTFNFANAYADAMDIVNTKKSSFGQAADMLKNAIGGIVEKINPLLESGSFEQLAQKLEQISSGDLSAEAIANAYGKSQFGEKH